MDRIRPVPSFCHTADRRILPPFDPLLTISTWNFLPITTKATELACPTQVYVLTVNITIGKSNNFLICYSTIFIITFVDGEHGEIVRPRFTYQFQTIKLNRISYVC
jgi:hypothetical protein